MDKEFSMSTIAVAIGACLSRDVFIESVPTENVLIENVLIENTA